MISDYQHINKSNIDNDFLKEYISFKEANLDAILLFQVGKFFETFFQDARVFSEVTGVSLGSRTLKNVGDILQAGAHINNIDTCIKSLLNENFKVCLCIECTDKDDKHYRKMSRKYTPGTLYENEFLESSENNYILSVYEYKKEFYLAYSDVSTGQFYKTKGDFSDVKFEIEKISPDELLICNSQQKKFKDLIAKFNTTLLEQEYFKDENVEEAILKYCEKVQKNFLIKFDKIIEYKINKFLFMDEITRLNLEMTRTRRNMKKKGSVLWFLNSTRTPMGIRLMKKYLSEPLLSVDEIKQRQNAIEELTKNEEVLSDLESSLDDFCDLSRMCAKISNSTVNPRELYIIVKNSQKLSKLAALCEKFKSKLLKLDSEILEKTLKFISKVSSAIVDNPSEVLKSGNIIRENYDAHLDYLKGKLNGFYENLRKYEIYEKKKNDLEVLKIDYSSAIGFYIEVPANRMSSFSDEYFLKQKVNKYARYTTNELGEIEENIASLKFQINELEYTLFCEIRKEASAYVESIRLLAKDLAGIDVFAACARCALENNFVKPEFKNQGIFIKNGFHPSFIKLKNVIVKNDTDLKNDAMIILTGANMSGKSTYLRHNAIICILAQMGCFVPADNAQLAIVDKIFLRQGSTDDIVNNNSSFMVEMNDLKFILDNATSKSYVLLDEPAKSTNPKESAAIVKAYCEYFLDNYKTKTILVTHNMELSNLEVKFPKKVFNYVMGVQSENPSNFRKIQRGTAKQSFAINTARLANLPDELIDRAEEYIASW